METLLFQNYCQNKGKRIFCENRFEDNTVVSHDTRQGRHAELLWNSMLCLLMTPIIALVGFCLWNHFLGLAKTSKITLTRDDSTVQHLVVTTPPEMHRLRTSFNFAHLHYVPSRIALTRSVGHPESLLSGKTSRIALIRVFHSEILSIYMLNIDLAW